eukprot:2203305-Lingulodinium_polyedra.AAC.1
MSGPCQRDARVSTGRAQVDVQRRPPADIRAMSGPCQRNARRPNSACARRVKVSPNSMCELFGQGNPIAFPMAPPAVPKQRPSRARAVPKQY